jgi:hypothetical protein
MVVAAAVECRAWIDSLKKKQRLRALDLRDLTSGGL